VKLFSYKNRPVHLGPLPLETLKRTASLPDLSLLQTHPQLKFDASDRPDSIINGMRTYAKYIDAARNGKHATRQLNVSSDLVDRARQMKSLGYFMDASHVSCCAITPALLLAAPYINPDLTAVQAELAGMREDKPGFQHLAVQELQDAITLNAVSMQHHTHVIVVIYSHYREVNDSDAAYDWLLGAGRHRACLRAAETATVMANFLRCIGFEARAHTESTTDLDLAKAAIAAGAAESDRNGELTHPYLGTKFGIAAISTTLKLAADQPLARRERVCRYTCRSPPSARLLRRRRRAAGA